MELKERVANMQAIVDNKIGIDEFNELKELLGKLTSTNSIVVATMSSAISNQRLETSQLS